MLLAQLLEDAQKSVNTMTELMRSYHINSVEFKSEKRGKVTLSVVEEVDSMKYASELKMNGKALNDSSSLSDLLSFYGVYEDAFYAVYKAIETSVNVYKADFNKTVDIGEIGVLPRMKDMEAGSDED